MQICSLIVLTENHTQTLSEIYQISTSNRKSTVKSIGCAFFAHFWILAILKALIFCRDFRIFGFLEIKIYA